MSESPKRPDQLQSLQKSPHRSRQSNTVPRRDGAYDEEEALAPPRRRAPPRTPSFDVPANTPLNPTGQDLSRKKSLIKPERNRIGKDNPLYNYHKHAQRMAVLPSTTGIDNTIDEGAEAEADSQGSGSTLKKPYIPVEQSARRHTKGNQDPSRKLSRADKERRQQLVKQKMAEDDFQPPSIWTVYCTLVTFWAPDPLLKLFGLPKKEQQRAWREKISLISIILLFCFAVGFLTFGFTAVVCGKPVPRLKVNQVDTGYMIINGRAYDLSQSHHPLAQGIFSGANVLYDLPVKYGGFDASFLFQNVNGECKGLITKTDGSDVPSNADGTELAYYFPCTPYKQDGSSSVNLTEQYYPGYACHTSATARDAYYGLGVQGEVYFTWDDIANKSRNLMVYSGNVLDLDLLAWFNTSQVTYPAIFDQYRDSANAQVRGKDVTHMFQSSANKKIAKCLTEIIRVGSVDTETVGCIASKVVLYVSLIFIITIVMTKFFLALFFDWFLSKKLGAINSKDGASRQKEIEAWSNDIYTAPPKLKDATDRQIKRGSFFPTTSRFTSPYAADKRQSKINRPTPMTMGSQSSTSKLLPPSPMYQGTNVSRGSLYEPNVRSSLNPLSSSGDRGSTIFGTEPNSTIVEQVVPQPPPEYQPFGFPLVHTICLVTAYSEGSKGIRNTLNSVATTDYPNSHKLMLVICDGLVKGEGEDITTPECVLAMMKEHVVAPEQVEAFSYVAVATGRKRHNQAKVYAGFYDYEEGGEIPLDKQQQVPMIVIVKCGTEAESEERKPGNRGKRDSQIILMGFLQKVMFDERMTELEYEMFSGIWSITGISPEFYEVVLMVDADTKLFPDSVTHMTAAMVNDPEIMGLCGETKIANKTDSWVSMIQVFEYFISHHLSKAFESVFGGVTCLPGCFCMYRIKAPKGAQNYWVPILANPDVVEHYSENVVDTLHKKNLLLLGEDRYLSTLMLKTFPKRKQVFVPQAVCKTLVPDKFSILLSQRRRWINSTIHNLMELVLVRDLCGTFCFSMQFVVMIDLIGTVVLPAAICFTIYLIVISIVTKPVPIIPLVLLGLILGLPAILIVLTANRWSYVVWMMIYLLSLPIWNFVLPVYAFWKFDDFSWGDTRKVEGETKKNNLHEEDGEFDSTQIVMRRWKEFEKEKMQRNFEATYSQPSSVSGTGSWNYQQPYIAGGYEHQNL